MDEEQYGGDAGVAQQLAPGAPDEPSGDALADDPVVEPDSSSDVASDVEKPGWRRGNIAAAAIPSAFYVLYVWHYSMNIPFDDDWSKGQYVLDALHNHFDFAAMWPQHAEARLLVPNLLFVFVGYFDRFNIRLMVVVSALVFIGAYLVLLRLFRRYLGRPLTPLPIFSVGVIWFSLADTGNSVWAFQVAWYLVILCFVLVVYLLMVRPRRKSLALALAIFVAVCGSVSMLQGFVIWPIGLICLLWTWERSRAHVIAIGVWLGAGLVTLLAYVHNYTLVVNCAANQKCGLSTVPSRPLHFGQFLALLAGYVVPRFGGAGRQYFGFHTLLGVVLWAGAIYIVVRALRERRQNDRLPLPLLLISFAFFFDVTIAIGRGSGRVALAAQSRFTMPNIILIVGLAVFAWDHVPDFRARHELTDWRHRAGRASFAALALFVVLQAVFTTYSGIDEGRAWHRIQVTEARVVVNLDRIPQLFRACYLRIFAWNGTTIYAMWLRLGQLRQEQLWIYEPGTYAKYRALGPPTVPGICAMKSATNITPEHGGT